MVKLLRRVLEDCCNGILFTTFSVSPSIFVYRLSKDVFRREYLSPLPKFRSGLSTNLSCHIYLANFVRKSMGLLFLFLLLFGSPPSPSQSLYFMYPIIQIFIQNTYLFFLLPHPPLPHPPPYFFFPYVLTFRSRTCERYQR